MSSLSQRKVTPGVRTSTREYVQTMDDAQARLALITQYHRVRLLGATVGGLLLFLGLLLVNVRNPPKRRG